MEKSIQDLIFIIGAIGAVAILINIVYNLLPTQPQEEQTASGDKISVINKILYFSEKCWEENKGAKKTKICFEVKINTTENINEEELKKFSRIPDKIVSEEINKEGKIIIKYAGDKIIIERR